MPRFDLILLHPPSVYDFRKRAIMYGPISDVIPPTPIFEMYPIGFVSLLGALHRHGYKACILNIAVKMLKDPKLNVDEIIRSLDAEAFGIDLHWMVHAHGSLEIAQIVKKHHPNSPVILGGLSSTCFHTHILRNYFCVDFIVRGDSAEKPLIELMDRIEKGKSPEDVPNVTWRNSSRKVRINPLSYVPETFDEPLDYGEVVRSVLQSRDLSGHLPSLNWLKHPVISFLTCKGCVYNCVTCGGSKHAYATAYNRSKLAIKDPELLVEEMKIAEKYVNAPTYLIGDPFMIGEDYVDSLLSLMKKADVKNHIVIEVFRPVNEKWLRKISNSIANFSLSISPESHDERVRRAFGRTYGNRELEKMIVSALKLGCQRFDVFFMIGLPYQTKGSVLETVKYCRRLIEKYGRERRVHTFMAPEAPFIDPGSLAFKDPDRHGYRLLFSSFEDYRTALTSPSWKYMLNYKTRWMKRDDIVEVTYRAAHELNKIKAEHGLIEPETAEELFDRIKLAQRLLRRIDNVMKIQNEGLRTRRLLELRYEMEEANRRIVSHDELLTWPFKTRIKGLGLLPFLMLKERILRA